MAKIKGNLFFSGMNSRVWIMLKSEFDPQDKAQAQVFKLVGREQLKLVPTGEPVQISRSSLLHDYVLMPRFACRKVGLDISSAA